MVKTSGKTQIGSNELPLSEVVDQLGRLKAKIADLCAQEEELKRLLILSDESAVDGKMYRASITHVQRSSLNQQKVRLFLTPQQLDACMTYSDSVVVRVSAKTRKG